MNKANNSFRYPCTRNIPLPGFGHFLEQEIGEPRRNLKLFTQELGHLLSEGKEDIASRLIPVNSGSSANLVAALALAEKLRNEKRPLTAVTSAFTFPTTMSALLLAGFEVTFADVEEEGFNLSADRLEELAEPPSLVVVTHFLGFPADMERLSAYRQRTGCLILQDACETLVCHSRGRMLYEYGDVITWSFYHPHHLSSYGGGAVYASSQEDFILCDSIAHWGRACKCHIDESLCRVEAGPAHQFTYEHIGLNVEMSELNACFGRWQLRKWSQIEERRKQNYQNLLEAVNRHPCLRTWDFHNTERDSPFVFPILHRKKTVRNVWEIMQKKGIEIRTLMGGITPRQKAYQEHVPTNYRYPNAEYMSEHAFFVGCHSTLTTKDIQRIGEALNKL